MHMESASSGPLTRRRFVRLTAGSIGALAAGSACVVSTRSVEEMDGRLTARPRPGIATSLKSGPLGIGGARDGIVQMPSVVPAGKVPLLVFLHGASQSGASTLRRISGPAEESGVAVIAPDSRGTTWDAIRGAFGEDVAFLNRVLEFVFDRLDVDPARIAIGGFSDGASYGLSLGLANGQLFTRITACSPGFVIQAPAQGRPRVFVSHGKADQILPIDVCSRVIVPRLRSMGYEVTFREFDGRHELPPDIASEAMRWTAAG